MAVMEPASFEAQVLSHLDALYALVRRRLSDRSAAEDVLQEALLRAWQKRDQVRTVEGFRPWLYRVVVNSIYEHLRRQRRMVALTPEDEALERHLAASDPTPLEAVLERVTAEQLMAALREVPEDFALAVELADLQGLSYREIAEALDVPIGTVMSRVYRGRRVLADILLRDKEAWGLEPTANHGS
jgi:RNA polymerase sigma-70 factor (ECF subfamily)